MSTAPPPLQGPVLVPGPGPHAVPDPPTAPSSDLEKHERVLSACGAGPFARALLLGAGTGALAGLLADRCLSLTAVDDSSIAASIAREHLADRPWAVVEDGPLPRSLPDDGAFDLVVVHDVLRRLPDETLRRTVDRLPLLLRPGARVVAVHWGGRAPGLRRSATEAHHVLRRGAGLRRAGSAGSTSARGHELDVFDAR